MDCSSTAPLENDSSLNGSLDTQRGWRAALSLLGGSIICQARSRRRAMWCFTILRLAVPFTSSIHARVLFDAIVLTGREYGNIGRTAHAFSTPRHFLSPSRTSASPMLVVRILSFSTRERERRSLYFRLPLESDHRPTTERKPRAIHALFIERWRPFEYENITDWNNNPRISNNSWDFFFHARESRNASPSTIERRSFFPFRGFHTVVELWDIGVLDCFMRRMMRRGDCKIVIRSLRRKRILWGYL